LLLQPVATALEAELKLPAHKWAEREWFQDVWFSPRNQAPSAPPVRTEADIMDGGAAHTYRRFRSSQSLRTAADHLAWYIVMLRNCIAHSTSTETFSAEAPLLADMEKDALQLIADSPIIARPDVSRFVQRFDAALAYRAKLPLDFKKIEGAAAAAQRDSRSRGSSSSGSSSRNHSRGRHDHGRGRRHCAKESGWQAL
jgi:hypothetical protein